MQQDSSNPNPNPNTSLNSSSELDPPSSPLPEPSPDPSPAFGEDDAVIDVSGETLDYPLPKTTSLTLSEPKGVYFYKNRVNLVPRWVNSLPKLRTFKFFANEVELFPEGFGGLVGLERLQVRLSVPELGDAGLVDELGKLEGLKELELSNVVRRKSALHVFAEISRLKCLTRLTLCHFSIRCLPPEIGNLDKLEYLDLSFNKLKTLPNEIAYLISLTSLKVASNKLAELPPGLSSMRRLGVLDLSHNRLTSLGPLDLCSMQNLQSLNLQYNKIYNCKIPPWLSCKIEGNGFSADESICAFTEMEVYEASMHEDEGGFSREGSCVTSASLLGSSATSSNGRCFLNRKSSKRWKRTDLQQRARQERLNSSRKGKGEKNSEDLVKSAVETSEQFDADVIAHDILEDVESEIVGLDDDSDRASTSEVNVAQISSNTVDEAESIAGDELCLEDSSGVVFDSISEVGEDRCIVLGCMAFPEPSKSEKEMVAQKALITTNSKRHCDGNLDNPKPCKFRKPTDEALHLSRKYSDVSLCGVEDYLPDGFYDGGRDQAFMPLSSYEEKLHLDSREVILMDRQRDEVLDAVVLTAQALISHFRRLNGCVKDYEKDCLGHLQVASLLALLVSDHFGGCDRSAIIERMRKAVSGHNYRKPFICTCATGNHERVDASSQCGLQESEDVIFNDLCERSLSSIKAKRKSVVVPIGSLKFGVCRHRALLLKYLCDRMAPPVPCELVRGYLDYMPHAWNVVVMKKGDTRVRMVVDACRPYDIREETDTEYFCRYIPLGQINNSCLRETVASTSECSLPSLSLWDEVETMASTSIVHWKSGSIDVAAKVRTIEVSCSAIDEIRRFECSCLGEVRILGALKHACIVELYGHRISSEWIISEDGNPERRRLKSAMYMEYIKGGSLKNYLEKLSRSGEMHAPFDIALFIAKDVASALVELHSKHIIHRDIKSENVLIDLDEGNASRIPVVKLCDFDRAVPLHSYLHSCCISHIGVHPPNVCVGTPRWMAPEVLRSMHEQSQYGLEVDIWSYGCLIFELLTLQVPYQEVLDWNIHSILQRGERPKLTDEIESLTSSDDTATSSSLHKEKRSEFEMEAFRTLINLFRRCTQNNPTDRPSAADIYESLLDHANRFSNTCNS